MKPMAIDIKHPPREYPTSFWAIMPTRPPTISRIIRFSKLKFMFYSGSSCEGTKNMPIVDSFWRCVVSGVEKRRRPLMSAAHPEQYDLIMA
jgi:hypothetical protein